MHSILTVRCFQVLYLVAHHAGRIPTDLSNFSAVTSAYFRLLVLSKVVAVDDIWVSKSVSDLRWPCVYSLLVLDESRLVRTSQSRCAPRFELVRARKGNLIWLNRLRCHIGTIMNLWRINFGVLNIHVNTFDVAYHINLLIVEGVVQHVAMACHLTRSRAWLMDGLAIIHNWCCMSPLYERLLSVWKRSI